MIEEPWLLVLVGWAALAAALAAGWAWATRRGDASIVDALWGYGIALLGLLYGLLGDGQPEHRALVGAMATLTGLKIGSYVLVTRVLGKEEDGRYVRLRAKWGGRATRNFFVFFQAQAFLALVLCAPVLLAVQNRSGENCDSTFLPLGGWPHGCTSIGPFEPLEIAGLALWLVATVGESLADRQLTRFRSDPANRGKVCQKGLWRVSRHPNYFFQICTWTAFALVATAAPHGWIGWLSPLVITASILFVTGIPPTEAQSLRSRGEAYRAYQRTTPVLVPWLPRRDGTGPLRGLERLLYWVPPEAGRGR